MVKKGVLKEMNSIAKTYKILVDEEPDEYGTSIIEIVEGKYTGVRYTYGKVTSPIAEENGSMRLSFEYDIVEMPEGIDEQSSIEEFETVLGDILVHLIVSKEAEPQNNDNINRDYQ